MEEYFTILKLHKQAKPNKMLNKNGKIISQKFENAVGRYIKSNVYKYASWRLMSVIDCGYTYSCFLFYFLVSVVAVN